MENEIVMPTEARLALGRGNKIEAIKIVREKFDLGLKEAKDLVDGWVEKDPSFKAAIPETNLKFLPIFLFLVVIAIAAAVIYVNM